MNLAIFGGRLGRDAELNKMSNGDPVANFAIAIDVGTRDNPKTMWVDCALFGERANKLQQYLTKGLKVTVSGRVSLAEFQARDGSNKTALRLTCTDIDMHLPPREPGSTGGYERPAASPAPARERAPSPGARRPEDDMDDDIPF